MGDESAVTWSPRERGTRVFLGTHTPRLDDKGRLFLPAKFRDELAEGLVVTEGRSAACTSGPRAEFRAFTDAAAQGTRSTSKSARDFMRCSSPAPPTRPRTSRAA